MCCDAALEDPCGMWRWLVPFHEEMARIQMCEMDPTFNIKSYKSNSKPPLLIPNDEYHLQ